MKFSLINLIFSILGGLLILEYIFGSGEICIFYAVFFGGVLNFGIFMTNPSPRPNRAFHQKRFERNFNRDIKALFHKQSPTVGDLHDHLQSRGWQYTGNFTSGDSTIYHWDHLSPDATFEVFATWDIRGLNVEKYREKNRK
jgi:hypothetical protein